jgi:hypothetical protein
LRWAMVPLLGFKIALLMVEHSFRCNVMNHQHLTLLRIIGGEVSVCEPYQYISR